MAVVVVVIVRGKLVLYYKEIDKIWQNLSSHTKKKERNVKINIKKEGNSLKNCT